MNIHEVDFSKMPTCECGKSLNELDPRSKVTRILGWPTFPILSDACSNLNTLVWQTDLLSFYSNQISLSNQLTQNISQEKVGISQKDRFLFLMMFWLLLVHEIGPFMPYPPVFNKMIMHAICGLKHKHP